MEQRYDARRPESWRVLSQIVWYALDLLIALLALRLVLRLLGANTGAAFTRFIYGLTGPFVSPFTGVIPATTLPENTVMEWSTLLAMLVYWIIAGIIVRLLSLGKGSAPAVAAEPETVRETKTVTTVRENEKAAGSANRDKSVERTATRGKTP